MKHILIRPLITEKTLSLASRGWYSFMVDTKADKRTIALAISDFYKVTVVDARVAMMHGKMRRVGKLRRPAKKPDWKKAIVRLAKDQKIDAFEVAPTEEGKKP